MDLRSTTPLLTRLYFRPAFSKPSHRPPIPICSLLCRHVSRDGLLCPSFARHANELPQGGVNNFGIVTHITLKTFPQSQVWVSRDAFYPITVSTVCTGRNGQRPRGSHRSHRRHGSLCQRHDRPKSIHGRRISLVQWISKSLFYCLVRRF